MVFLMILLMIGEASDSVFVFADKDDCGSDVDDDRNGGSGIDGNVGKD